jgi:hypothetical protein
MSRRYTPPVKQDDEFEEEEEASTDEEELEEVEEESTQSALAREALGHGFLSDPWPKLTFGIMILGFIMVIFTPVSFWNIYRWNLFGTYAFVILATGGSVFSFRTWKQNPGTGLRYGGFINGILIAVCGAIGTIDALKTIITGSGLLADVSTPLFAVMVFIVVMCMYSVAMVQRMVKRGS